MKATVSAISTVTITLLLALALPAAADEPTEPEKPKITHENLYQMEELVKQGADPNAPYWLYPGLP